MKHCCRSFVPIALAFTAVFASSHTLAQPAPSEDTKKALLAQKERAGVVADRGARPHYTQNFDLSGLPHYVPSQPLTGWIRLHGSNYLSDGALGE